MNEIESFFNNESSKKLFSLMKNLQDTKKLEQKIWESYGTKTEKTPFPKAPKRFKTHPKSLSSSNSDLLKPDDSSSNEAFAKGRQEKPPINLDRKYSTHSIKTTSLGDLSSDSVDCVTIRKDPVVAAAPVKKPTQRDSRTEVVWIKEPKERARPEPDARLPRHKSCKEFGSGSAAKDGGGERVKKSNTLQNLADKKDAPKSRSVRKHGRYVGRVGEASDSEGRHSLRGGDTKGAADAKNDSQSSKRDTSSVQKEIMDLKLNHIMQKTLHCMEDIRLLIDDGAQPPDGAEDFDRRRRRANEFSSRFARNYLYQLNRQITEINKILKSNSGRVSSRSIVTVHQKLVASHQTILQGLQAYHNHLPTTIAIGVPDKIKELLRLSFVLCDIQRSCSGTDVNSNTTKKDEIIDIFEVRSKYLLEKIEEFCDAPSSASALQSHRSRYSLSGFVGKENCKAALHKNSTINTRYSMYTGVPFRKDVYWKRAVAALAKKKFNVQSKYKTAYFKHRPPLEKQQVVQKPPNKIKLAEKKSSIALKLAKSAMNDENITTMVQVLREKDNELGVRDSVSDCQNVNIRHGILAPLVEKMLEKIKAERKDMSQDQVKNILQSLVEMVRTCDDENQAQRTEAEGAVDVDEMADRLLKKHPSQKEEDGVTDEIIDKLLAAFKSRNRRAEGEHEHGPNLNKGSESKQTTPDKREVSKRKERKKTVTVSGAKNAQLICIKDEDSLIEPTDEDVQEEKHYTTSRVPQAQSYMNFRARDAEVGKSNMKLAGFDEVASKVSVVSSDRASKIKISRLPKRQLRCLGMLPKQYALNVLQYKVQFLKSKKGNPMYRKSSSVQPWNLMGVIADKLLEELLGCLGREIQVNEIIEKIYASELI